MKQPSSTFPFLRLTQRTIGERYCFFFFSTEFVTNNLKNGGFDNSYRNLPENNIKIVPN